MSTKGDAASHLYWSRGASNKPPPALTAEEAKARKSDAVESDKEWTPLYKWGQRKNKIVLTIFVPCLEKDAVDLDIKPTSLSFRAERVAVFAGNKKERRVYTLSLQLRADVDPDTVETALRHDHVRVELTKMSATPWRSLQPDGVPKNANERPDFDLADGLDDDSDDDDVLCRTVPSVKKDTQGRNKAPASPSLWSRLARHSMISAWEAPPFLLALAYVAVCPLAKVEESFALQATHDILYHRSRLSLYDHHDFPGVVPRTFIGPLFLALLSAPFAALLEVLGEDKLAAQHAVRAVLGCVSCACLVAVLRATRRQYGRDAAHALVLLTCSQFHWLFYCSRTLPNTFAAHLVLLATARWIDGEMRAAIKLLTIAVVIFRFELVLLLAPLCLLALLNRQIGLVALVRLGVSTAAGALLCTVVIDSYFWRRTLYPEGEVLYFNTVLNKSGDYGTSPFHWYFTSALPRAMLAALPLALLSLRTVPRARALVGVPLAFIAVYSILPHKELRFVLYAVPPLNVAAAAAAAKLYRGAPGAAGAAPSALRRTFGFVHKAALLLAVQASVAASAVFLAAAYHNYPGGRALEALHRIGAEAGVRPGARSRPVHVHIGVEAAMTGVSRFLERPHPWRYSKAEGLKPHEFQRFAYVLAKPGVELQGFSPVHTETGFARVVPRPPFFTYEPKIVVHKRQKEQGSGTPAASKGGDFHDL